MSLPFGHCKFYQSHSNNLANFLFPVIGWKIFARLTSACTSVTLTRILLVCTSIMCMKLVKQRHRKLGNDSHDSKDKSTLVLFTSNVIIINNITICEVRENK
jgi:hypothetical protein